MSTPIERIADAVHESYRARAEAIEHCCEVSLTHDDGGVLVTDGPMGAWTVEVSKAVPWGEIHYREER